MIEISSLSKSYLDNKVLDDININLPDKGLIAIVGPSGCGKTTLLNCLSGLIPFSGHIKVNDKSLENLNEKELDGYRLHKCGFVFQDFKLFVNETAYRNILFPLDVLSSESKGIKNRRVLDLLSIVGLKKDKDKLICKMSGGEKQRVAIARALTNNPKIVLCDEPTGSLDSKNSIEIMKILKRISLTSLVVVVSHDQKMIKEYADRIITLKDGRIIKDEKTNKQECHNPDHLLLARITPSYKKPSISTGFLLKHTLISLKQKKFRTLFSVLMTSLGLLGIGLCLSVSALVSSSIKSSYSAIIDEDQVVVENKASVKVDDISSANYYDVKDLRYSYPEYINDFGAHYHIDYETFFSTRNQFYVLSDGNKNVIEGLSTRHINEFVYLEDTNEKFYPSKPDVLENDEIIVSITMDMIEEICFSLKIKRSVNSLSEYLLFNDLYVVLDVANDNWEYEDEQIFHVLAFSLSNRVNIYHSNHLFNEYVFEDQMRFPVSDYLYKELDVPYKLRKLYYLDLNLDYKDQFFVEMVTKAKFDKYRFESAKKYYKYLYEEIPVKDVSRVLVFNNPSNNTLTISNTHYLKDASQHIDKEIYGTNKGIVIYPSSLLMGFANSMFVSYDQDKIDEVNDVNSYLSYEESKNLIIPEGVVGGCYYKVKSEGLTFSPLKEKMNLSLSEIVISKGLAESLFKSENPIGRKLYLSYVVNEKNYGDQKVYKEFVNDELVIKGVIDAENKIIYHNPYWSILYFQVNLGISVFDLDVNNISFTVDKNYTDLDDEFPQYNFVRPLNDINKSIDEIVGYLTTALIIFSSICILIAILMLLLINNLNALDSKKDIYLARVIGISKKESGKFVTTHTYLLCFISFMISLIELLIATVVISKFVLNTEIIINSLAILAMMITAVVISLITVFISKLQKHPGSVI